MGQVWRRVISASVRSHVENIAVNKDVRGGYLFYLKPNRWALQPDPPAVEDEVGSASKTALRPQWHLGLVQMLLPPGLRLISLCRSRQLWRSRWSGTPLVLIPLRRRDCFNSTTGIISST